MDVASRPISPCNLYVHVLVFACPRCFAPLCALSLDVAANLELADARACYLACGCGWSGDLPGIRARNHFVGDWHIESPGLLPT